MYELHQEQFLDAPIDEIWDFISHPANLNEITPPQMDFDIQSSVPDMMRNGLLIKYEVKLPLLGHSEWVTEIKHIVSGKEFVDEQRIGPYNFWYHRHQLEETDRGTKMIDHVSYQPPYGILGQIANTLLIRNKLEEIFNYRKEVLDGRYNI
ncbi:Ligand-binding SRPBCC domain-containing protein [Fodinibius salinus]|uniref:Ligand-binding SRPBCC domain-containing protein n=1 Tax=Fodinibius salinus TaxID=860790 RepID=A0A5D3YNT1_9BACT|nr:SRPBCC family protein [Fodinibius salinus]TYP93809.1 Ligand-binding SRPBCC domain-containing protein [Fodinibius salinus]